MSAAIERKPTQFSANFLAVEPLLAVSGPDSIHEARRNAIERFEAVGIPSAKDEEFKYLPLKDLSESAFQPAYGATIYREDLKGLVLNSLPVATIAFVNGQYAPELSNLSGLPAGCLVWPLQDLLGKPRGLEVSNLGQIATLEGKLGSTNDERFTRLNAAFLDEGAYVHVAKNVQVETPIHLRFLSRPDHGPFAAHPRIVIDIDPGAKVKVIESYEGIGSGVYFTNAVTEIALAEGAVLEHIRVQIETSEATHVSAMYARQEANSTLSTTSVALGAAVSRLDVNVDLEGEHTESWLNGVYVGMGSQVHDHHTRIDHAKPNCHSFEVYKGILGDSATGVFNGKIFVYEDAQKTDAKQTNQALLLSKGATMNSKPQLEIFADDVKCTHGATIGQIREDALFYLRARGIPEAQARAILVNAFVDAALDRVTIEPLRSALEQAIADRLKSSQ